MTTLPKEIAEQYSALASRLRAQEMRRAQVMTNLEAQKEAYKQALKKNPSATPHNELTEAEKALLEAIGSVSIIEAQITELEHKTIGGAVLAKYSLNNRGVMAVFHINDDGKKASITRHLTKHGTNYTGQSIFNRGIVSYQVQL